MKQAVNVDDNLLNNVIDEVQTENDAQMNQKQYQDSLPKSMKMAQLEQEDQQGYLGKYMKKVNQANE